LKIQDSKFKEFQALMQRLSKSILNSQSVITAVRLMLMTLAGCPCRFRSWA
jgi:hypothetical protein